MKKINFSTLLFLVTVFCFQNLFSVSTGSFTSMKSFNGETRILAYYVPTDYSETKVYSLLIGLHGAGDNAISYRDVLINNAKWQTLFPNTIFVFPDGGSDQAKDFYTPAGDEAIIDSIITWVNSEYKINLDSTVIQGFSLGGRSALKFGLDNPDKVAGLILHTPAMQSPLDVANNPNFSSLFNYSNANKIKISMVHGSEDIGFLKTVKMLSDSLVENNAKLWYITIPQMAHTISPNQITQIMHNFIFTEINEVSPIIHKLSSEVFYNEKNAKLYCIVRNIGTTPITSLTLEYTIQGQKNTFNWTGSITNEKYAKVEVPNSELPDGAYMASISITNCNGEAVEANPYFNIGEAIFNIFDSGVKIPFLENFSDVDKVAQNFAIKESGNFISWMPEAEVGKDGAGCMFMLNSILAYTNMGLVESLFSNKINFKGAEKPSLSFDVAYNYTYYMQNNQKYEFIDTLQIVLTNDNWKTSKTIFKKWGEDLRTFAQPIVNAQSLNAFLVAPTASEWKNYVIDLTSQIDLANYNEKNQTMFRIDYISGSGGVIFFDNFKAFDDDGSSVTVNKELMMSVYPNPAIAESNISMTLNSTIEDEVRFELYNYLGQKLAELLTANVAEGDNSFSLKIPNITSGSYILKAKLSNSERTFNLIVK